MALAASKNLLDLPLKGGYACLLYSQVTSRMNAVCSAIRRSTDRVADKRINKKLSIAVSGLVVSQVELVEKKSMYFFAWQGGRTPHGEPCNDEQHRQAKKDAIYSRRFSLTDY
jgi:trehalose-6-phosphate synthase